MQCIKQDNEYITTLTKEEHCFRLVQVRNNIKTMEVEFGLLGGAEGYRLFTRLAPRNAPIQRGDAYETH